MTDGTFWIIAVKGFYDFTSVLEIDDGVLLTILKTNFMASNTVVFSWKLGLMFLNSSLSNTL